MKKQPLVSVITVSNRPYLWKDAYNNICEHKGDIEFEHIFVGPEMPDFSLPSNVKHIKTGNIKPPQCWEIGRRNITGKMFMLQADDVKFYHGGMSDIYKKHLEVCDQQGNEKVIVVPSFRDRSHVAASRYGKARGNSPIITIGSSLISTSFLSEIGGSDIRFVGIYGDNDWAMRMHGIGVYFEDYNDVHTIEFRHKRMTHRLHRICKPYDRGILDSFWTRFTEEPEPELPEDAYEYMKDHRWVITKKRQKSIIAYEDEDILTKTQGVKEYGGLKWD
jgi:hypothetical protein